MIAKILMICGAASFLFGFVGLIRLMLNPIKTIFMVVFKMKDDYVFYESDQGKKLLKEKKGELLAAVIFFMVIGAILFGIGAFMNYAPRGNDSIFSQDVEHGINVGDDEIQNNQPEGVNAEGVYVDENGIEYSFYISVTGTNVYMNSQLVGNATEFEEQIKNMGRGITFYLIDDFGSSATYKRVQELLNQYGINYETDDV